MFLNVDVDYVKSLGIIPANLEDRVVDKMQWSVKGRGLEKSDLAVIDLLVNSNWERPIYMNTTSLASVNFDIRKYAVQEGIAYRILPVSNPNPQEYQVDLDVMYDNIMNKYQWRELDNPNVYYSEDYRNFVLNHRSAFNSLAISLMEDGQYKKAEAVIEKCLTAMPNEAIPFDYFNMQQVGILLELDQYQKSGEVNETSKLKSMADNIAEITVSRNAEMLDYMIKNKNYNLTEMQQMLISLNTITRAYRASGYKEEAAKYEELFNKYYQEFQNAAK